MGNVSASEDRVLPPVSQAVSFIFEQFASNICDQAKVDYQDRPYKIREWTVRMERSFQNLVANDRITDEVATHEVLKEFGPVEDAAKEYRGGLRDLWRRLLYYERYSIHRMLGPVVFAMLHAWLRTSGSLEVTILASRNLEWRMVMFGWNYFIGIMTVVVIVAARILCRTLPIPKLHGEMTAMAVTLALFSVIAMEWWDSLFSLFSGWNVGPSMDQVPVWQNTAFGVFLLGCYLLEAVAFFLVLTLVMAEIFDFSTRKRIELERLREENFAR